MKINMGNFGNAVARPAPGVEAPAGAFGVGVSQALAGTGRALTDMGAAIQQNDAVKRRADAAISVAQYDNDVHGAADTFSREIEAGTVKAADAMSIWQKRVGEIRQQRFGQLDGDTQRLVEPTILRTNGAIDRKLQGVVQKRQQSEIGASIGTLGEQFQRHAMRDLPGAIANYHGAVDQLGPQAGWTPEQMAKAKQGFTEGASFNFANATLEGAAQTGNVDLIRAAMDKIGGPEGEALDPARRTALMTKGYGFINAIEAANVRAAEKADRERLARETKAESAVTSALGVLLKGGYLDMESIDRLATVTAGTSFAAQAQALVKDQGETARFATMPSAERKALLEAERARAVTKGQGTSLERSKQLDQLERIDGNIDAAASENVWQAAQKSGVITRAPVFNIGNIGEAQQIIGERMQEIDQIERWTGKPVSPLQPQEAQAIGRLVRALPPDQQSGALAGFGQIIGDADRVADLARQMDGKDKVLATAMMFANSQTTAGRFTSELVLKGERALRDKSVKVEAATETGWKAEIARTIGDAYPNQELRQRMIDAAFYVQVGLAAEGTDDVQRAVRLTAGQIREQRDGSKVPLPYGWDEDRFEKSLSTISAADLASQTRDNLVYVGKQAVPLDQFIKSLPDAALVHAGPGRYNVRAGTGIVTTSPGGSRLTIQLR